MTSSTGFIMMPNHQNQEKYGSRHATAAVACQFTPEIEQQSKRKKTKWPTVKKTLKMQPGSESDSDVERSSGSLKSDPEQERGIRECFNDFCRQTILHGWHYLVDFGGNNDKKPESKTCTCDPKDSDQDPANSVVISNNGTNASTRLHPAHHHRRHHHVHATLTSSGPDDGSVVSIKHHAGPHSCPASSKLPATSSHRWALWFLIVSSLLFMVARDLSYKAT